MQTNLKYKVKLIIFLIVILSVECLQSELRKMSVSNWWQQEIKVILWLTYGHSNEKKKMLKKINKEKDKAHRKKMKYW